ncbi:MAG: DUF1018 domain-containing protein [Helicobacteraceae bacterium]|nr:DUF1018 domain-containing protein [Helicobacteraceae bacterium]
MKLSPKQQTYHQSLIKLVHTSLKYRNYYKDNRDEYEELLLTHFRVESSKELSIDELIQLVDYLNHKRDSLPTQKMVSAAQLMKIKSLWADRAIDKSTIALLKFSSKITQKALSSIKLLTLGEAQKLIISLNNLK